MNKNKLGFIMYIFTEINFILTKINIQRMVQKYII